MIEFKILDKPYIDRKFWKELETSNPNVYVQLIHGSYILVTNGKPTKITDQKLIDRINVIIKRWER